LQTMKIILVGFMGCGKSTLGKKLANKLGVSFLDSDEIIENRFQKSISDLFSEHGEDYFRNIESELINDLSSNSESFVFSTGGGMPCFNNNMDKLNALGDTYYLKRSPKELAYRLANSKTERPLIKGLDKEALIQFVEDKLMVRNEFYDQSKFVLTRDLQSITTLVDFILQNQLPQRN
jgi:shikimate kinase